MVVFTQLCPHTSLSSLVKEMSKSRRGLTSLRCHLSSPEAAHCLRLPLDHHSVPPLHATVTPLHKKKDCCRKGKTDYGILVIYSAMSFPEK